MTPAALELSREQDRLPSGLIAGRYRVEATLGRGAAGAVLAVFDTAGCRRVALKQLVEGASERLHALFEQEYYTLAALSHPGIVRAFDYGSDGGRPYYTMELLNGSDLTAHAPFALQDACRVVSELAAALSVLHARRLVHRDISPRNVWRQADGSIKLIDFGALAPFGLPRDVVGTPPLVAPEALLGQTLDQRTDLYSLGALLYWMLSGVHAYPAHSLKELHGLWSRGFTPLGRALSARGLAPVPVEVEALIESLLSRDPLARPGHTAELIERLRASAALPLQVEVARYVALPSSVLVGRERERTQFNKTLAQSYTGLARPMLFEGEAGAGRTRLLRELSLSARLGGACALYVEASQCEGAFGVARALLERALDAAPEQARAAAEPHAATLALLSPLLSARLAAQPVRLPSAAGEARARMHEALRRCLTALSEATPLVILVDDVERADEASQALLLALAQAGEGARIVCVASLLRASARERSPALRALCACMRRFTLRALDADETRSLVDAWFGDVPHTARLAERLFRASGGLPGRLVGLADQLVRDGTLQHVDSAWLLPQDIPPERLVFDRAAALAARMQELPREAQILARSLSVHRGLIHPELIKAVCPLSVKERYLGLDALLRAELWLGEAGGYRFSDEPCQRAFAAALSEAERREAHTRVGQHQLDAGALAPADELAAHVHLLEGAVEDADKAHVSAARVAQIAAQLVFRDPDGLRAVTPAIERAVTLFRAQQRSAHAQVNLLAALTVAGYFIDRQLAVRYGEQALAVLSDVLGLSLAHKLRRWLGKRLALSIGLLRGAIGFALRRRDACVPRFPEAIRLYFNCAGALAGVAAVCIDAQAMQRFVQLSDPWTGLGPRHFTQIIHDFNLAMLATLQDRGGEARGRWRAVLERLATPEHAAGMPEDARIRYLAGALYAAGVLECFSDGPDALGYAERLDGIGLNVCAISADQIRTQYYAHRGDLARFEHYRARVERAALEYGSAWQAEIWSPSAAITVYLRTHDALAAKLAWEQVRRHGETIPSQALLAERYRGALLSEHRSFAEAVEVLEANRSPKPELVGWGRTQGVLARALNGLGEHQRALAVTTNALQRLSEEDLALTAFNLGVVIEHALAQAGLGECEAAAERLDSTLRAHAEHGSPLTLGALHEARALVAFRAGDVEGCHEHRVRMERYYRGTRIPALVAHCEALARALGRALTRNDPGPRASTPDESLELGLGHTPWSDVASFEQLLRGLPASAQRAEGALAYLLADGQRTGALFFTSGGRAQLLAESRARPLPDEVGRWVERRAGEEAASVGAVTETADLDQTKLEDPNLLRTDELCWQLWWLRAPDNDDAPLEPLGALVLGKSADDLTAPSGALLHVLATHLR